MTRRTRLLALVLVAMALAGCSGSSSPSVERTRATASQSSTSASAPTSSSTPTSAVPPTHPTYPIGAFDAADAALDARVASAGLAGGYLRIVADDGTVVHEHGTGSVTASTPLELASSTKWLTAATFMTFVDQHAIGLDDDIGRWLPEFAGSSPPITPRELLDHTSGVHDNACQNGGVTLAACVRILATSPREFAAGTQFSYGNSPFLVVGRLVEVLGSGDFASIVQQRLTGPLGMTSTSWPGAPTAANPAFGAITTVDDYGRFVAMLEHRGTLDGARELSPGAVDEMVRNQVGAYDTTHDYSVGITGIPRYGLGCWPDVVAADGTTEVVSGNGGKGWYPWIDFASHTWGIVGVQDDRGAQLAVPASQAVEVAARAAFRG